METKITFNTNKKRELGAHKLLAFMVCLFIIYLLAYYAGTWVLVAISTGVVAWSLWLVSQDNKARIS